MGNFYSKTEVSAVAYCQYALKEITVNSASNQYLRLTILVQ